MSQPFDTVLIANRGEIACRIIRACQALGLGTVAVYSEADRHSLHVQMADQAYCLGPAPAADSYLHIPALLAAAQATGAQALHPGYGFLAEKPELAEACAQNGLVFVGPRAEILRELGAKTAARERAQALGIPVVPGRAIDVNLPEACQALAAELGYPLLVKAVGGGGGRGMRLIGSETELLPALASAAAEAHKAFSDDRLYLEKRLSPVRHIEFQILGDSQGQIIHLGERECSLQRRYQKIWEEAPAPHFSPELRQKMGADAVRLASSLAYVGAGTVEFILDSQDQYYFLEVNPRIQVEHPVTEAITGLDLVQLQLRIAAGEALPLNQESITHHFNAGDHSRGHAIEVRICAEDPMLNFAPVSGTLARWEVPANVRVESGIVSGAVIGTDYDSLLAKLIVHAPTREQAMHQMRRVLSQTVALGLPSNLPFLRSLCESEDLIAGQIHTGWLEAHPDLLSPPEPPPLALLAAATLWRWQSRPRDPLQQAGLPTGWRNNPCAPQQDFWRYRDQDFCLRYRQSGAQRLDLFCETEVEKTPEVTVQLLEIGPEHLVFECQKRRYVCQVWQTGDLLWLHHPQWGNTALQMLPRLRRPQALQQAGDFCAVLPGKVIAIAVQEGQTVAEGDRLLVLESMKMETCLNASFAGVVQTICVSPLQQVRAGQKLIEITPLNSASHS